jgi:hypothetical protein
LHDSVTVARWIRERILEIDENKGRFAGLRCVSSGGRSWACALVATNGNVASKTITAALLALRIFEAKGMAHSPI